MRIRLEGLLFLFVVSACAAVPYSAHAQDTNAYLYIAHALPGEAFPVQPTLSSLSIFPLAGTA